MCRMLFSHEYQRSDLQFIPLKVQTRYKKSSVKNRSQTSCIGLINPYLMNRILIPAILIGLVLVLPVYAESLNTGGPYSVGEQIVISGETNFNTDNRVLVEVYPASFGPTSKYEPTMTGGNSTVVPVVKGEDGSYSWSANMSSATWSPDQYMVRAEVIGKDYIETSIITITEKSNTNTTMNQTTGKENITPQVQKSASQQEAVNQSPDINKTSS